MYKMCYGFLDGQWEDYLIPKRERRTPGNHDFKFIVPKGHKDILLDYLSLPGPGCSNSG